MIKSGLLLLMLVCTSHVICVAEQTRSLTSTRHMLVSQLSAKLRAQPQAALSTFQRLLSPILSRIQQHSSQLPSTLQCQQSSASTTEPSPFQRLVCDSMDLLANGNISHLMSAERFEHSDGGMPSRDEFQNMIQLSGDATVAHQDAMWFSSVYIGITLMSVVFLMVWHSWVAWFCTFGSENMLIRNRVLGSASLFDGKAGRDSAEYKNFLLKQQDSQHTRLRSENWQEVSPSLSTEQLDANFLELSTASASAWQNPSGYTRLAGNSGNTRGWCRFFNWTRVVVFVCVFVAFIDAINAVYEMSILYGLNPNPSIPAIN